MSQMSIGIEFSAGRFRVIILRIVKPYEHMVAFHSLQDLNEALQKRRGPASGRIRDRRDDSNPQSTFSAGLLCNDFADSVRDGTDLLVAQCKPTW